MSQQANKILKNAFVSYKKKHKHFGIAELAKSSGLPYTSVYNTLNSERKCNAEIWLKIMECLGAIEVTDQKLVIVSNESFCLPV